MSLGRGIFKVMPTPAADDEPRDLQRADLLGNAQLAAAIRAGTFIPGSECEALPRRRGSFGATPENPIPVNGPIGETVYLNRLRAANGAGFLYHRLGSVKSGVCSWPVDEFELVATDASEWWLLFFSIYHPCRSSLVPAQLYLLPWSTLPESLRRLLKFDCLGTRCRLREFPRDLPDAVAGNTLLNTLTNQAGEFFPERIRAYLNAHPGAWERPAAHARRIRRPVSELPVPWIQKSVKSEQ